MRSSKGYTDELEKLNCDDSGLAVTIGLKEAAPKKVKTQNHRLFSSRILVFIIKQRVYYVIQKLQYL